MAAPLKLSLIVSANGKDAEAALSRINAKLGEIGASAERASTRGGRGLGGLGDQGKAAAGEIDLAAWSVGNLGAQFNDIAVMMAAGQNPLQLALQQGTQISQLFNGASIRQIGTGLKSAFLSIISPASLLTIGVIAGGAALVQWGVSALGAADDGKVLEEQLKGLSDANAELAELSKDAFAPLSDLKASYGAGAAEAQKLLQIEQQRAAIRAEQAVQGAISAVQGSGFGQSVNNAMFDLQASAMPGALGMDGEESRIAGLTTKAEQLAESFGMAGEDLSILIYKLDQLDKVQGAGNQAKAIQDIIAYTIEASGGVENITGETALWFDALLKISDETAQIAAQMEINVARGQDMLAAYQAEADMAALVAQYGAESAQVTAAKLEAERLVVAAKVEALGLSESEAAAIMQAWDQANGFTDAVIASAVATGSVVSGIGNITAAFDPAIVKAGQLALAIRQASAIPGMSNPDPSAPIDVDAEMAEARRRAIYVAPSGAGVGAGAGGGGAGAQANEVQRLIEAQQRELELLRETDPVQKELLRNRQALEGATAAERAALEQLITQRKAEEAAMKAQADAQAAYRDMAYGALEGLILKGQSFGEVIGNLAGQLAKLLLQAALLGTGPLAGLFGGGGLGGGLLGLVGLGPGKADGGMIHGRGGPRDDRELTPTSPGEFIVNAAATARNRTLLETINGGGEPRFSRVEPVGARAEREPQRLDVSLSLSEDLDARITSRSQAVAMDVTRAGLQTFSRQALPGLVQGINADPRARR